MNGAPEDIYPVEEVPRAPPEERLPSECGTEELDPVAEGAKAADAAFAAAMGRASADLDRRPAILEAPAYHRSGPNEGIASDVLATPW